MRLRAFQAANMAEAMGLIRSELGDDAVIVGSETGADGVRVVAATDSSPSTPSMAVSDDVADTLYDLLDFHRAPPAVAQELIAAALAVPTADPVLALGTALESAFAFRPLHHGGSGTRPLLLVGPTGHGKTVTAARLAARAVLAAHPVRVLAADTRAGAVAQLTELCRPMGLSVETASAAAALADALARPVAGLTIIDGPGVNPLDADEMAAIAALAQAADAEPVLILAAGSEAEEATDIARAFADVGATRFVATRLDAARRLGGVLAAAAAGLAFADGGVGRTLAETLVPMNPLALARLLASKAAPASTPSREKAA